MLEISIDTQMKVEVDRNGNQVLIKKEPVGFELKKLSPSAFKVISDKKIYDIVLISQAKNELNLMVNGKTHTVSVKDHIEQILNELGMSATVASKVSEIKAPMPGTILGLSVSEGDAVEKGTPLLILEAMKMENVIKSPGEGVINKILISQGDNVEKNELLISFK